MCSSWASSAVLLIVGSGEEAGASLGPAPSPVVELSRDELRCFFAAGEFGSSPRRASSSLGGVASGVDGAVCDGEGIDASARWRTFCFRRRASLRANRPGCGSTSGRGSCVASCGAGSFGSTGWSAKSEGIRALSEDLLVGLPEFIGR